MLGFEAASVSDLVNSIKNILEDNFEEVVVQGEVSNLSPSGAGHIYFTLSDENSSISCALFKSDALRNPLVRNLKNGDKIVVLGPVSVFQKRGTFQILAKRLFPAGEGQLQMQFERLKAKLAAEGLFDLDKKKALPKFPRRIAVITAEHGAALQDFLNVLERRTLWMDVVIVPALVQGENAPRSLISALKKAQCLENVDTIVLTRGGGSIEDLWAFNDEALVRAISEVEVPVVSAVGHQVDFTLCDFVSDFRAETPTAAAETLSQPQTELLGRITYCQSHLRSTLLRYKQHVEILIQKFHPKELLGLMKQKIHDAEKRLRATRIPEKGEELVRIAEYQQRVDEAILRLRHGAEINKNAVKEKIQRLEHVLKALDPTQVLNRGYSYVKVGEDVMTSSAQFNKEKSGTKFQIIFHDGTGTAIKD